MARTTLARKKRLVTWKEVEAFAAASGRDLSHVYRVLKRERASTKLESQLAEHFGAPFDALEMAGRNAA